MKHKSENNAALLQELSPKLRQQVAATAALQPTEDENAKMMENLQRKITEQGAQENSSKANAASAKPTHWLRSFAQTFAQRPMQWAGSMGVVLAIVVVTLLSSVQPKSAFASVVEKLQQIDTMVYSGKMSTNGQHLMDVQVHYQAPGFVRVEISPNSGGDNAKSINVMDVTRGKGIILFPASNRAMPFDFDPGAHEKSADDNPLYWLEEIKNYAGEPPQFLPTQTINGVQVDGFVLNVKAAQITVWSDRLTNLPVKLKVVMNKIGDSVPFQLDADMRFNQAIDAKLFSLDIAEGYQLGEPDSDR